LTEDGWPYKPEAFATFAETHNRQVEARRIAHRDYPDKRYLQAGWTVIAPRRRGRHRDLD